MNDDDVTPKILTHNFLKIIKKLYVHTCEKIENTINKIMKYGHK